MAVTADGEFGALEIDGTTNVVDTDYELYQMGSGYVGIAELTCVNRNATGASTIRVCIVPNGGAVGDARYLEYGTEVQPGEPLKLTNITIAAQAGVHVRSDQADTNFYACGITKAE